MSNYTYPNTAFTFGARDALAPSNAEKIIKGTQLDAEFTALEAVSSSKLNSANPTFTGTMNGGTIDGGTF
jgi:hypothetical protein